MNREGRISTTRIGLGLAAIGRPEYINLRKEKDPDKSQASYRQRALDLLDHAYARGIRDFDTAASYGKGEEFLQEWYNQHPYQDLRLGSKWGYTYVANWKIGYSGAHEVKEHSLEKLKNQWKSAKNLLPALKTYQIHSATFESRVLENREVLGELARIKKNVGIKIGVSVSGEKQKELLEYASGIRIEGKELFDSFQATYNVLDTSAHKVLSELLDRGKKVIVKEALANGRLFRNDRYPNYSQVYEIMDKISSENGAGTDAIALRFVMDRLKPTVVLSGASSIGQLESNLEAESIRLDPNEIRELSALNIDPGSYWSERKRLPWN
jgi:aryl-alcohol dehydrogenase-like predicted oxidoreductase